MTSVYSDFTGHIIVSGEVSNEEFRGVPSISW